MPKEQSERRSSKPYDKRVKEKKKYKSSISENDGYSSDEEPMELKEDETEDFKDEEKETLGSTEEQLTLFAGALEKANEEAENKALDEILSGKIASVTHDEVAPTVAKRK
jgi:hypothetical protein